MLNVFSASHSQYHFAFLDDLSLAYEAGINEVFGSLSNSMSTEPQWYQFGSHYCLVNKGASFAHGGDYSVIIIPQLEAHRHPMPLPEGLIQKLSGGYYFSKLDLADAYGQITLAPESQKRQALSIHRAVLLQKRFCYGISQHWLLRKTNGSACR